MKDNTTLIVMLMACASVAGGLFVWAVNESRTVSTIQGERVGEKLWIETLIKTRDERFTELEKRVARLEKILLNKRVRSNEKK